MDQLPSNDMEAFRKTLRESKHIIAVAGAGLSAASGELLKLYFVFTTGLQTNCVCTSSGIGTFRGAGGLWRRYDAMNLATPEAFQNNPSRVWQFYHYRREKYR